MAEVKQAVESRAREVVDELAKSFTELCQRYMSEARVNTPKPATVMSEAFTSAPKPKAPNKADPAKSETKQPNTCWECGDPSHRLWQCSKLSREDKLRLDRRKIRPVTTERSEGPILSATEQTGSWSSSEQNRLRSLIDHKGSTSIIVRYRTKPIQALVDTGSELSIAGLNLAKQHRWKIRPTELQAVKVANGESMRIHGIATEILTVRKRSVRSEIFITPDIILP